MQLRTFLARNMQDALAEVRAAMGGEAVIVASERVRGGGVMVRAALDEADGDGAGPPVPDAPTADGAVAGGAGERLRHAMIRRLHEPGAATRGRHPFDRAELIGLLARHRLPEGLANRLAELADASGLSDMTLALAAAIDARLKPSPIDFRSAQAVLLAGLGGAGKTATAAKLAAHAQLAGRQPLLIGTDTVGAGAVARLETFAAHLGADVETAPTAQVLMQKIDAAGIKGVMAIVDTAGIDPRRLRPADADFFADIENVETIGVISAMTDGEEAAEIAQAFKAMGARRLVITGLDTVRRFGGLAASALCEGMNIAFVTRSPFVAGGLETPTPLFLARLLAESEEETSS
jgi:flagellar biosynthesis protein FlhF